MEIVKRFWLEAIFNCDIAKQLYEEGRIDELKKAVGWYQLFQKELERFNIKNGFLEDISREIGFEKPTKDEINNYLRSFREALYYEANISGNSKKVK
ncbi:MAG: hypothetical protein N2Z81_04060 [Hydrogenothermaceae bacterium]|nr:hypothetical protein [Hydrogenothermaceae bacterium]